MIMYLHVLIPAYCLPVVDLALKLFPWPGISLNLCSLQRSTTAKRNHIGAQYGYASELDCSQSPPLPTDRAEDGVKQLYRVF